MEKVMEKVYGEVLEFFASKGITYRLEVWEGKKTLTVVLKQGGYWGPQHLIITFYTLDGVDRVQIHAEYIFKRERVFPNKWDAEGASKSLIATVKHFITELYEGE